jgi:hypothetical protein
MSRQVEEDRLALQSLKTDVERISAQLTDVKGKLSRIPDRSRVMGLGSSPGDLTDLYSRSALGGPRSFPKSPTGPASGNSEEGVAPTRPSSAQATGSEQVASYRKDLIDRNALLHQADRANYGDQITQLYQAARSARSPQGGDQASEAALSQLMTEYPQSNSTALVLSEKALQAARQANTVDVEKYYGTLATNENFPTVVTDSGVEAKPAIEAYLANQYIQQNRISEANALLQDLENNYGSGLLATPGRQGTPQYRSVSETVAKLRSKISTPTTGK